ncbi:DNA repair protein RadC [Candidatus Woesearchaeota archaeon]|nr:MAG: DNA repair protein RadC [archaeon GW2011_AR4]MBS3129669.1 DNA repair protein RadC [Candidatus Woesearchaeota archaeon]HIH38773.1 JAB domain-containing protein [Candidatus Woesearchaeota archaeon]HIH49189.1 JAB domain-containing protein [Candidatus Woesearchaeota archaeon]HIJ03331.1 JAB domain-containing protein [Candidatus Woesearchaeota archaeon]
MRIQDISPENRPRERLKQNGVDVLSNCELLAVILQKGTKNENVIDMSNRLLAKHSIDKLSECSLTELKDIPGIGDAKAMQILALFELSKRIKGGSIAEKVIHNSEDIASYYMEKLKDKKKEYFIAVFLDSKNKIIKDEVISVGTLNASLVHPREVFKEAIKHSANSIILVHNHPSGDCEPSTEDEEITGRMKEIGELMGIQVLDHVVVATTSFTRVMR